MKLAWNIKITIAVGKPSDGKLLAWMSTDYTKEQRGKTQPWISPQNVLSLRSIGSRWAAGSRDRQDAVDGWNARERQDNLWRREGWRMLGGSAQSPLLQALLMNWTSAIIQLIKVLAQTSPVGKLSQCLTALPLGKHELKATDGQFRQI